MDTYNSVLDYKIAGCIVCRNRGGTMNYRLPVPFVSTDSRVDARAHEECYWAFINVVRVVLRIPTLTQTWR